MKKQFVNHLILFTLVGICNATQSFGQSVSPKVVMISIDGTPDYLIDRFLKNGVLPPNGAFAKIKNKGTYAKTVLPVNVASTGPSHISIFTGASPNRTGIIGNSFKSMNDKWEIPNRTAFSESIGVETIFQAAMRQGKKVMTLGAVGIDGILPSRSVDYFSAYPNIVGPSLVIDLKSTRKGYKNNSDKFLIPLKEAENSYSKPFFEVTGKFRIPLYIYRADSIISDANILSDITQIIIDTDSNYNNGYATIIIPGEWSTINIEKEGKKYNASFRLFNVNEVKGEYTLFMSAPAEVYGYPQKFYQQLQDACGLWPGEPENRKQTAGIISEQIWFEQLDRLAKYYYDIIIWGMKNNEWDLLFGYFTTLDDLQHRYTLTNPRQLDYTAENSYRKKRYEGYIESYFQKIDQYLLNIMNAAPAGTNFIFFSDHGMIPIHTTIVLNNYFEQQGFKVSAHEVKSASSGTSAHIYINKEKVKNHEIYLAQLKESISSLKDPLTNKSVFEIIAIKKELKKYGLYDNEKSGDLFVSCKSGYSITDRFLPNVNYLVNNSFDPQLFADQNYETKQFLLAGTMNETGRGVHGGLGKIRELQSIFYAYGPNIPKQVITKMESIQIAAIVANLLNITISNESAVQSLLRKK